MPICRRGHCGPHLLLPGDGANAAQLIAAAERSSCRIGSTIDSIAEAKGSRPEQQDNLKWRHASSAEMGVIQRHILAAEFAAAAACLSHVTVHLPDCSTRWEIKHKARQQRDPTQHTLPTYRAVYCQNNRAMQMYYVSAGMHLLALRQYCLYGTPVRPLSFTRKPHGG